MGAAPAVCKNLVGSWEWATHLAIHLHRALRVLTGLLSTHPHLLGPPGLREVAKG